MNRFFTSPESIQGDEVVLTGEVAHRISRVLRMSSGDDIVLFDGMGNEYIVKLVTLAKDSVTARVLDIFRDSNEPKVEITLCQGLLKGKKLDWVIQKGTELGIKAFVPLICNRSVPKSKVSESTHQMSRWLKIMTEAAEQSRRSRVPDLYPPTMFEVACRLPGADSLGVIPWESARSEGIRQVLKKESLNRVYLFVGPEGGFENQEVLFAQGQGIKVVSLGRRILRAETAGIVTATAILYEAGELCG